MQNSNKVIVDKVMLAVVPYIGEVVFNQVGFEIRRQVAIAVNEELMGLAQQLAQGAEYLRKMADIKQQLEAQQEHYRVAYGNCNDNGTWSFNSETAENWDKFVSAVIRNMQNSMGSSVQIQKSVQQLTDRVASMTRAA